MKDDATTDIFFEQARLSHPLLKKLFCFPLRFGPFFNACSPWICRGPGRGFTLLELLMVVSIVGTLAAIAIPVYSSQIEKVRMTKCIAEIRILEREIALFREAEGSLPVNLAQIGRADVLDPWGNAYRYGNHDIIDKNDRRKYKKDVPLNMDYDLYSMGPDGQTHQTLTSKKGRDDIVRADDGGYVGSASEF